MLAFSELSDIFGLFVSGLVCGLILLTLFWIIGTMVTFVFNLMSRG